MENLKEMLISYKEEHSDNKLIAYVVDDILDKDEDSQEDYIKDVLEHGCVSGIVTSLIYYTDTDKFFLEYHDEIFDLINECKEVIGELPNFETWNFNSLAWYGYEQTMYGLSNDLEIY